MATKKGIIVTIIILASITALSFLVWLIPASFDTKIIVSDFKTNLDNTKEIHLTLNNEINEGFKRMLDKETSPQNYIEIAEVSSSQINSLIIQLVESNAPEEWHPSYMQYIEALRKFNSQIRETIVIAQLVSQGESDKIGNSLQKIESYQNEANLLVSESDKARP